MTRPDAVVLAIEASQRRQSVALGTEAWIDEESVDADRRDVEDLMPAIERVALRRNVRPSMIAAVLVDGGPGGFTGLRIAHAAAQAMSLALGVPLVQVPAAAVAREVACREGRLSTLEPCWVALACKGDEAWTARLDPRGDPDAPLDAASRTAPGWDPAGARFLISDEHLPAEWVKARDRLGMVAVALRQDARGVLEVGRRLLAQGRMTPPETMVPLYPREAEAVRLWRLRHGARADGTTAS